MSRVTVAVPSFNGALFLTETVRSVLEQTYRDFELLVVDDGSSDGSAAVVGAFADPRIRLVRNPANLGLTGNWLRCLELAEGEFVALLHQDDAWRPGFLQAMVGLLDDSPGSVLASCGYELVDGGGQALPQQPHPQPEGALDERSYEALLAAQYIQAPSWLARRSLFASISYDRRFRFAVDWDFYLRVVGAAPSRVVSTASVLARYRVHSGSESYRPEVLRLRLAEETTVLREALARRPVSAAAARRAKTMLAARQAGLVARLAIAGRWRLAGRLLADSVRTLGPALFSRGVCAGAASLHRPDARRALFGG